jgi:hypothetical protein
MNDKEMQAVREAIIYGLGKNWLKSESDALEHFLVPTIDAMLAEATANALRMAADLADRIATLVDDGDEKATVGRKILDLR